MDRMNLDEDTPIENKMLSKSIENAQTSVESRNFQSRKATLEYDDVMNKQREIIYGQRKAGARRPQPQGYHLRHDPQRHFQSGHAPLRRAR